MADEKSPPDDKSEWSSWSSWSSSPEGWAKWNEMLKRLDEEGVKVVLTKEQTLSPQYRFEDRRPLSQAEIEKSSHVVQAADIALTYTRKAPLPDDEMIIIHNGKKR